MGVLDVFKGKKYKKCVKNEDGTIDCVVYHPTKDGKKIVTATTKSQITPECTVNHIDVDGDPDDIEEIERYLGKAVRTKCKQPGEI